MFLDVNLDRGNSINDVSSSGCKKRHSFIIHVNDMKEQTIDQYNSYSTKEIKGKYAGIQKYFLLKSF